MRRLPAISRKAPVAGILLIVGTVVLLSILFWGKVTPSRESKMFSSGHFSLNYSSENPLPAEGLIVLRDGGKLCNLTVERRPLQGGGALFESFVQQYSSSTGSPVLRENGTDFTTAEADYSILFCDGAAFITRATGDCFAKPSCQ